MDSLYPFEQLRSPLDHIQGYEWPNLDPYPLPLDLTSKEVKGGSKATCTPRSGVRPYPWIAHSGAHPNP
jgi:hypothetical protein